MKIITTCFALSVIFFCFTAVSIVNAQPAGYSNKIVEIDGKKINVATAGLKDRHPNQPAVILQSGLGTTLQNWNEVMAAVAEFAPVVAYDRPGIGKSEMLDQAPTPAVISEHLHKLLKELNIQPPYILVGHSWGGPLINNYAVRYPKDVAGMVFVDESDIVNFKKNEREALKKMGISEDSYEKLDAAMKDYFSNAPEGIKAEMNVFNELNSDEVNAEDFTPEIEVPVAIIMSQKYEALPPDFPEVDFDIEELFYEMTLQRMKNFVSKIKGNSEGTFIVATHAGHFIHSDDPNLVIESIRRVTFPSVGNQLQLAYEEGKEEALEAKYNQLRSYYPTEKFNENQLNSIGYNYLQSGKMNEALAVFKLNVKNYPNEANPYDSLGDAYAATGKMNEALRNYEKAVQLAVKQDHPNKELYRSKLERLKKQKEGK